jgi:hypothetical protein
MFFQVSFLAGHLIPNYAGYLLPADQQSYRHEAILF